MTESTAEKLLFGKILKKYRSKAKISQGDFAEMMGVTRNTVTNWESER